MKRSHTLSRVVFALAVGILLAGCSGGQKSATKSITPTEDLLREHAVISRLLLIFNEDSRRLHANQPTDAQTAVHACDVIRKFVQDYHEKNEENYIFNAVEMKGTLNPTTAILRQQHDAGRKLIDQIKGIAGSGNLNDPATKTKLAGLIDEFVRMYEPHKAVEGSVVFPAYYDMSSASDLDKIGETFEDQEHKLFGKNGYEDIVNEVAGIEKTLGINDLAQFTPKQGS